MTLLPLNLSSACLCCPFPLTDCCCHIKLLFFIYKCCRQHCCYCTTIDFYAVTSCWQHQLQKPCQYMMPVHAAGNSCCKAPPLPNDITCCCMATAAAMLQQQLLHAATTFCNAVAPILKCCSAALPLSSFVH